jgi:hypothetical protein
MVPLVALMVAFIAVRFARTSAVEWGDAVKASFDTFLPELGKKLVFPSSATRKDQEELWNFFSKIIDFRSREDLDDFLYTVQEVDTIDHIAQRFGITVEELVKINNTTDTELISVGQRLRVWPK